MLKLSRRSGESILIDGTIEVTILAMRGNRVCVGVEAPREVKIDRKEVWLKLAAEEASSEETSDMTAA